MWVGLWLKGKREIASVECKWVVDIYIFQGLPHLCSPDIHLRRCHSTPSIDLPFPFISLISAHSLLPNIISSFFILLGLIYAGSLKLESLRHTKQQVAFHQLTWPLKERRKEVMDGAEMMRRWFTPRSRDSQLKRGTKSFLSNPDTSVSAEFVNSNRLLSQSSNLVQDSHAFWICRPT